MPGDASGSFATEVALSTLTDTTTRRIHLLVGTGAMWTWVPADVLERAGIAPRAVARFRALDGRVVERLYADARIACRDRDCASLVVFALEGDQSTLGDHALLCMGLEIDPETQSLRDSGPALALAVLA